MVAGTGELAARNCNSTYRRSSIAEDDGWAPVSARSLCAEATCPLSAVRSCRLPVRCINHLRTWQLQEYPRTNSVLLAHSLARLSDSLHIPEIAEPRKMSAPAGGRMCGNPEPPSPSRAVRDDLGSQAQEISTVSVPALSAAAGSVNLSESWAPSPVSSGSWR
jgi:hypothetical protein